MNELFMIITTSKVIHYWISGKHKPLCGKQLSRRQQAFARVKRPDEKLCEVCLKKWVVMNSKESEND